MCKAMQTRGVATTFAMPMRAEARFKPGPGQGDLPVFALDQAFDMAVPDGFAAAAPKGAALVAADRRLRGAAAQAGLLALPHLSLIEAAAQAELPDTVRLQGGRDALMRWSRTSGAVPMQFQPASDGNGWAWIGLAGRDALAKAALDGFHIALLPYDIRTHDLLWARLDEKDAETQAALAKRDILYAEPGQALIALGPEESPDALNMHGDHGHAELLSPMPDLLEPPANALQAAIDPDLLGLEIFERVPRIDTDIIIRHLRPRCSTVTQHYEADLDRYTGPAALDAQGPIVSRHIGHPDNKRAEAQLLRDLRDMGYCPWRHDFQHAGQTHSNIIADLPGTGRFRLYPDFLNKWRHILVREDLPDLGQISDDLLADLDKAGFSRAVMADLDENQWQLRLEELLGLRPWQNWWCLKTPVAGFGAGILMVGCHLDSTAGFDTGFDPATDPAPGRDDDGSGLAGVLSIARHMASLRGKLTHTVRFCFFNAEEAGLVGSKAYAASLKAQNAPVIGTICMDMIGYNSDANRLWEVHAGYTDPAIRDASVPLAQSVADAAQDYGALPPAQIYQGTSSTSGSPDRSLYDGAINRSDHAAFHQQGWPAVVVSEDFFANLATEPAADGNVNYHRAGDTFVDIGYARDIVCAVARAVTLRAQ
jgi:hypothetical protein